MLSPHITQCVALLAEGVDRNTDNTPQLHEALESPSSRRAWIEISRWSGTRSGDPVALLAEGVDRNVTRFQRNWQHLVALLAEGVDRN